MHHECFYCCISPGPLCEQVQLGLSGDFPETGISQCVVGLAHYYVRPLAESMTMSFSCGFSGPSSVTVSEGCGTSIPGKERLLSWTRHQVEGTSHKK